MTLPAAFLTALAQDSVAPEFWIEIEGIPYGFGMKSRPTSFFSGRSDVYQRQAILPSLVDIPAGAEQEVKPLDGDSSVGSMEMKLLVDDDPGMLLSLLATIGRIDLAVSLGPPTWGPGKTYAVGEIVKPTALSTASGAEWAFTCTTGGTSGSTEPAWPDTGTVSDGSVVWTANDGYPEWRNWPANATTIGSTVVSGSAAAISALPSSGILYVGRETVIYISKADCPSGLCTKLSSVYRARYRLPGHDLYYAHSEGSILAPYPRFLASRRMLLLATLDGTDANKVIRFSGHFDGRATLAKGLGEVRLVAGSALGELKHTLFGNQLRAKLYAGLANSLGGYESETEGEPDFETEEIRVVADSKAGPWDTLADDTVRYFRIEDEYLRAKFDTDADGSRFLIVTARGLFGSEALQHSPGAEVREVMILAKQEAAGSPEFTNTYFTAGDTPVDIVLSLLSSTGGGWNGSYDTLPEGWGSAVAAARIDVAGAKLMRDRWLAGVRHVEIVEEPFEAKAKFAQILAPHAFYSMVRLNDVYAIRRVQPPFPDVTIRQVTHAKLIAAPTWESDFQSAIGRILWRCDLHPIDGESRQTFIGEIQGPGIETQEFYAGLFQTLEVEARGQYTGNDLGSGVPSAALATGATDAAYAFIELVKDRYSKPWPTLGLEGSYDLLDVEPGDLIEVTALHVPNAALGLRDLVAELFEVLSREIDDVKGLVRFVVIQALYGRENRLLSPAGTISAVGSNYVDLASHDFSASDGQVDAAFFIAGDTCSFYTSALVSRAAGPYTVQGVSGDRVTFTGSISGLGIVAGDVLLLADYANATAYRKARDAFLADAAETLGSANDPAHEYAG